MDTILLIDPERRLKDGLADKILYFLNEIGFTQAQIIVSRTPDDLDEKNIGRLKYVAFAPYDTNTDPYTLQGYTGSILRMNEKHTKGGLNELIRGIMQSYSPASANLLRYAIPQGRAHAHAQINLFGNWYSLCPEGDHAGVQTENYSLEKPDKLCKLCDFALNVVQQNQLEYESAHNLPNAKVANWLTGLGIVVSDQLMIIRNGVYGKQKWKTFRKGALLTDEPLLEEKVTTTEREIVYPRRSAVTTQFVYDGRPYQNQLPPDAWWRGYFFLLPDDRKTIPSKKGLVREFYAAIRAGAYKPLMLSAEQIQMIKNYENGDGLISTLLSKIDSREGVKNFFRCDAGEVIVKLPEIFGDSRQESAIGKLTRFADGTIGAYIKSIGDGSTDNTGAYRPTFIQGIEKLAAGEAPLMVSFSKDQEVMRDKARRETIHFSDIYVAALAIAYAKEMKNINILPFKILNGDSYYSRNTNMLSTEIIIAHYFFDIPYYQIDNALLAESGLLNDAIEKKLVDGTARLLAYRQARAKDEMTNDEVSLEKCFFANLRGRLRSLHYEQIGYQAEFVGTEYETISEAWQKGNRRMSIVVGANMPPLIVERDIYHSTGLIRNKGQEQQAIEQIMSSYLGGQDIIPFTGDFFDPMDRNMYRTTIRFPDFAKQNLSRFQSEQLYQYIQFRREELLRYEYF